MYRQIRMCHAKIGRNGIPKLSGGLCVTVVVVCTPCPVHIKHFSCGTAVCNLLTGTLLHAFREECQCSVCFFHIRLSCFPDRLWF